MTISINIGRLFNDDSHDALIDELKKRNNQESILEFEKKFNIQNEKNLHMHICRFLKNRQISRALAAKWLLIMLDDKESQINTLSNRLS